MKFRATLAVVLASEQSGCKEARETLKAFGAQLPDRADPRRRHRSPDLRVCDLAHVAGPPRDGLGDRFGVLYQVPAVLLSCRYPLRSFPIYPDKSVITNAALSPGPVR